MSNAQECPPLEQLQLLAVGRLPDPPASLLEEHLLECSHCAEQTAQLHHADTLVSAIRQAGRAAPQRTPEEQARLERLMNSLSGLPSEHVETAQFSGPRGSAEKAWSESDDVARELSSAWRPAQAPDEIGRLGGYRILKTLGAGGMGAVFLAEDLQLQRRVALKMMRPRMAANPGASERFLREARAAAALRHQHILTIYQVGEEAGVPYLAMEYLEGESLEDRLKREPTLPIAETLRIGCEIAEGLAAAHSKGLTHRDIKPANVWLEDSQDRSARSRVKLLDFGLARSAEDDAQLTSSGVILGTPSYMAPEQARGDEVDSRADLFSLGVILYRMTTGQLPFPGKRTLEILTSLFAITPAAPRTVNPETPQELSDLIEQLLAKDAKSRPESATAVARRLAEIEPAARAKDDSAAPVLDAGPNRQGDRAGSRRRLAWALAGCAAFALLGVVIVKIKTNDGKETEMAINVPGEVLSATAEVRAPSDAKAAALAPVKPAAPRGESLPAMSADALVLNPAKLEDVESWTIETRAPRGNFGTMAFDPAASRLAIGSPDGTIRILNAENGKLERLLLGHVGAVHLLEWSSDGKTLFSAGYDLTVRGWDVATGRTRRLYALPKPNEIGFMPFFALVASRDGRVLAAGGERQLLLWNVATGEPLIQETPPGSIFRAMHWNSDGSVLAAFDEVNSQWIFRSGPDKAATRIVKLKKPNGGWSRDVFWSEASDALLGFLGDGSFGRWSAASGELIQLDKPLPNGVFGYRQLADGRVWAFPGSSSTNYECRDALTGAVVGKFHSDRSLGAVEVSPDGRRLVAITDRSGGPTGLAMQTFDLATGQMTWQSRLPFWSESYQSYYSGNFVSWSPRDKRLLTDNPPRIWDVAKRTLERKLGGISPGGSIHAWSPLGDLIAISEANGVVLYDAATLQPVRDTSATPTPPVFCITWAPDGQQFATLSNGPEDGAGYLRIWQADSGQLNRKIKLGNPGHHLAQWSPDVSEILVSGYGAELIDVATGKPTTLDSSALELAWSPSGRMFALSHNLGLSGPSKSGVFLFDDAGHAIRRIPLAPVRKIANLEWSPDERLLAIRDATPTIDILDLGSNKVVAQVSGGQNLWGGHTLSWSPDGSMLATISQDGKTRLWDAASWQTLGTLTPLDGDRFLIVSPDGHYLGGEYVERDIAYVVQTAEGQLMLSQAEFEQKYGWKNDPGQVLSQLQP